jgi:hypothetical protein
MAIERMDPKKIPEYQNGAEGFIKFVEENVRFSVPQKNSPVPKWLYPTQLSDVPDPTTGKSFRGMWEEQKKVLREALEMRNGQFVYRLIAFCWPRGEGKSLIVCLIQIWKFFCFPRQQIVFGALSKDQTRFVHYEMIQSVILNSPKLVNVIGKANVQRAWTVLKNSRGETISSFQPISSYSGIVSNITGYTFSEMFDMKDPKFFVQLDGSIRNIINALGTIDSTVSTKDHVLYRLYRGYINGEDRLTFFHHRSAPNATPDEYWHPYMNKEQLDSYRRKFPPADFDRYFRNVWELESGKLFSEPAAKSIFYYGFKNNNDITKIDDGTVVKILNQVQENEIKIEKRDGRKNKKKRKRIQKNTVENLREQNIKMKEKLIHMDNVYKLHKNNMPRLASNKDLRKLTELYDTNWSVHAGIDRSDPLAKNPLARTIVTIVAKGLTGSRSKYKIKEDVPSYIYILLHLSWIQDATLEGIKNELSEAVVEYDGIDTLCSERWGTWDLAPWCEDHDVHFEPVFPSFEKQKKAFSEMYIVIQDGRFKSSDIIIPGSISENILSEELQMFDYDPQRKWYGSPQKNDVGGVQDDSIFSLGWCIYGGREFGVEQFRERIGNSDFGSFVPNKNNFARYDL